VRRFRRVLEHGSKAAFARGVTLLRSFFDFVVFFLDISLVGGKRGFCTIRNKKKRFFFENELG